MGIVFQKRPVGDTVVEDLDYEINEIHLALAGKADSR